MLGCLAALLALSLFGIAFGAVAGLLALAAGVVALTDGARGRTRRVAWTGVWLGLSPVVLLGLFWGLAWLGG